MQENAHNLTLGNLAYPLEDLDQTGTKDAQ